MKRGPRWIDAPEQATAGEQRPLAWIVDLGDTRVRRWEMQAPLLTDDLQEFYDGVNAGVRLQRRRLTRLMVGRMLARHPAALRFGRSPVGGPMILDPQGWFISVAGRDHWCVVAISRHPIGVDVEACGSNAPLADMLTQAERDALALLNPADRIAGWTLRWAGKEAHAKRLGDPMTRRPEAISVSIDRDGHGGSAQDMDARSLLRYEWRGAHLFCIAMDWV